MWLLNTQTHKALQNPSIEALLVVLLANPTWHSLLSKTSNCCLKKHHNDFRGAAAHACLDMAISEQRQSCPSLGVLHGAVSCMTRVGRHLSAALLDWIATRAPLQASYLSWSKESHSLSSWEQHYNPTELCWQAAHLRLPSKTLKTLSTKCPEGSLRYPVI